MAWDIVLESFGVILAIIVSAQILYLILRDRGDDEAGDE